MKTTHPSTVYDEDALLYRLHDDLSASKKQVIFVVGSPLTAPYEEHPGVADVAGIVDLIRKKFSSKSGQLERFQCGG